MVRTCRFCFWGSRSPPRWNARGRPLYSSPTQRSIARARGSLCRARFQSPGRRSEDRLHTPPGRLPRGPRGPRGPGHRSLSEAEKLQAAAGEAAPLGRQQGPPGRPHLRVRFPDHRAPARARGRRAAHRTKPHGHLEAVNRPPAQAARPPAAAARPARRSPSSKSMLDAAGLTVSALCCGPRQAPVTRRCPRPARATDSGATGREAAGHTEARGGAGRACQSLQHRLRLADAGRWAGLPWGAGSQAVVRLLGPDPGELSGR